MFRRPSDLRHEDFPVAPMTPGIFSEVEPLLMLCAKGKLYEVEQWIDAGRPIQYSPPVDRKLQRKDTPLMIAVRRGFHSLAALLLANGYDPSGDYYECISPAVWAKDHDMIDLLLRFGADPNAVDFCEVLETCDRALMDRFVVAGIDPCRRNAVARAVQTKRRPILGFIKQYQGQFPGIQRQIDIALHAVTEAADLRGVALMLWLGANPHAPTPSSAEEWGETECDADSTAFHAALFCQKSEVMDMIAKRPIPADRVASIFHSAGYRPRPGLVKRLLEMGADPNSVSPEGEHVLHEFVHPILSRFMRNAEDVEPAFQSLELVLKAGAKWTISERRLKWLRRDLIDGESRTVVRLLDLLHQYQALTPEQLHELTRTDAVKRVLNGQSKPRRSFWDVGYSPPPPAPSPSPPPQRGYWKRHWSQR